MAGGIARPCYCNFTYCTLASFQDGDDGAGVFAASEGALVASSGFAPPPSCMACSPHTRSPGGVGKATDRVSFFPARIPLLSYNIWIVPKFAGFSSPFPRSRFYVALQRAHV
jgi:hypothetical protein